MPSTRVARKASLVNNTCVFGSMAGNGKKTGRSQLEMRQNVAYPNTDPLVKIMNDNTAGYNCIQKINWLKSHEGGRYWEANKMTGGVGRRSLMYNMQLRW